MFKAVLISINQSSRDPMKRIEQRITYYSTFKAVCFRRTSFDLNMTAAIQIVTKKPASARRNVNITT